MVNFINKNSKSLSIVLIFIAVLLIIFIFTSENIFGDRAEHIATTLVDLYLLTIWLFISLKAICQNSVYSDKVNNNLCAFSIVLAILSAILYFIVGKNIIYLYLAITIVIDIYLYLHKKLKSNKKDVSV